MKAAALQRWCATLLVALALGGCATLHDSCLFVEEPDRTDHVVLPDDETDVVGDVQVAVARYEDTLPDFARRYGLGHDEIVAANPGVDPWLPGNGTRVVLPTQLSHGSIQLYPEDIARLFEEVPIGTKVTVVNQPYLVGTRAGEVYLEAHAPLAEDQKRWNGSLKPMEKVVEAETADGSGIVDWEKARGVALEARGFPVPISIDSPGLEDVVARARRVPRIPPWVEIEDGE